MFYGNTDYLVRTLGSSVLKGMLSYLNPIVGACAQIG